MTFFNELTLKNKIFTSCLGFTLIVSIIIALFTRSLLISSLTNELKKRGVGIAQSVADGSRVFILTKNRAELTALAYDARLGNRKDILLYLLISDKAGHILGHTFTTGLPGNLKKQIEKWSHEAQSIIRMQVGNHWVFHVSVPVKEGIYTIGSVQVGLDQQHIESLISRLRLVFLSFLSVVSIIFFFLSHRLALHITKPVASLIRYTDQLTKNNFSMISKEEVDAMSEDLGGRDDEIAALTNSFIKMMAKLKLSTDNLMESQKKYRSLFHSGPNPIFVIHKRNFEILDANPKATELFGYDGDELIGLSLLSLGNLENDKFARTYPVGESVVISSKVRFFKKDGGSVFVNIHASPAEYRDKDVIIVAATDITELVEKDSQLIQASYLGRLVSQGLAPHILEQIIQALAPGSKKERTHRAEQLKNLYKLAQPKIRINTLGEFNVRVNNTPLDKSVFEGVKPISLLKAIVMNGSRDIPKEILIDALWPDAGAGAGEKNFKINLHRLRKALEPDPVKEFGYAYVSQKSGLVSLDLELIHLDIDAFMALGTEAVRLESENKLDEALVCYGKAARLYKGDYFAEDPYLEWIGQRRDLFRSKYIEILEKKALLHEDVDQWQEAVDTWRAILGTDPFFEAAYRNLMILYADADRKNEALHVFKECCSILKKELDTEPEFQTREIYARIREL